MGRDLIARGIKAHTKFEREMMAYVIATVRRELREEMKRSIDELRIELAQQRGSNIMPMRSKDVA